jgi:hypothetical protein
MRTKNHGSQGKKRRENRIRGSVKGRGRSGGEVSGRIGCRYFIVVRAEGEVRKREGREGEGDGRNGLRDGERGVEPVFLYLFFSFIFCPLVFLFSHLLFVFLTF